jgi:hypothetical protein
MVSAGSCSLQAEPTIHDQQLSVYVARFVRRQEKHRRGDLIRRCHPSAQLRRLVLIRHLHAGGKRACTRSTCVYQPQRRGRRDMHGWARPSMSVIPKNFLPFLKSFSSGPSASGPIARMWPYAACSAYSAQRRPPGIMPAHSVASTCARVHVLGGSSSTVRQHAGTSSR